MRAVDSRDSALFLDKNTLNHMPSVNLDSGLAEDRLMRILLRQFQQYSPCRSNDLPGQENVFQPEGLNLLLVFPVHAAIHDVSIAYGLAKQIQLMPLNKK